MGSGANKKISILEDVHMSVRSSLSTKYICELKLKSKLMVRAHDLQGPYSPRLTFLASVEISVLAQ